MATIAGGAARGMQVLFVSSEVPPWVKSGGLADVTAALPAALRQLGIDVRILAPGYRSVLAARVDRLTAIDAFALPGGAYPAARVLQTEDDRGVPLYLIDAPALYDRPGGAYQDPDGLEWADRHLRFGLLSRIAAFAGRYGLGDAFRPRIVHCNDWPAALAPAYLAWDDVRDVRTIQSIHNLAHQGIFPRGVLNALAIPPAEFHLESVEYYGNLSFLKAGLRFATRIIAVSPRYALEIQTPAGGHGMHGLLQARSGDVQGILNGIDTEVWNPARDPHLAERYDRGRLPRKRVNTRALQAQCGLPVRDDVAVLGVVSRLTHQKGLDALVAIADQLMRHPVQLVLLGSGERAEEDAFRVLAARFPLQVSVTIGFDEAFAHRIEAGADLFLMPSRFEPCGLNQMYSMRYGTPPIVRATGGLADTVVDCTPGTLANGTATGFILDGEAPSALLAAIVRALEAWRVPAIWRSVQANGMARDWSWTASARAYAAVYEAMGQAGP